MAELSSPTSTSKHGVEGKKTPHRASSLCCHEPNDGRKAKLNHTPSMKARQQSRHSCKPDTPREAPAHRSVSWTRAQKRPLAGQGRQEGQRQEAQQGRAGNTGKHRGPHKQYEEHTNQKRQRARGARDGTMTRAPPGNTTKEAQDRQGEGGQHRQCSLRGKLRRT